MGSYCRPWHKDGLQRARGDRRPPLLLEPVAQLQSESRLEAATIVVPFAVMITPLQELQEMPALPYDPVPCKACGAILNTFCQLDLAVRVWTCPFCYQRNYFPGTYALIRPDSLPAELFSSHRTVEYVIPQRMAIPSAFIFVVDLCQSAEDLESLKNALLQLLSEDNFPDTSLIGLISFSRLVLLHELGYSNCGKSILLRGEKESTAQEVQDVLGLSTPATSTIAGGSTGVARYVLPLADCEFTLTTTIEELRPDRHDVQVGHRARRATGAALAIAVALVEALGAGAVGRVMLMVSGPCTEGPGKVVGTELDEAIRTHKDIAGDSTLFYRKACRFYNSLAERLLANGFAVDMFACSLDQVGAAELKSAIETTGGFLLLAEEFASEQFRLSLHKLLCEAKGQGQSAMFFDATLEVKLPPEIKVAGALGPCSSMRRKTSSVSETWMGLGGTDAWKLCTVSKSTAVAVYFELSSQRDSSMTSQQSFLLQVDCADCTKFLKGKYDEERLGLYGVANIRPRLPLQFLTGYRHSSGQRRLRVVTTSRYWAQGLQTAADVGASFDQEASLALIARLAAYKAEREDASDVVRWLDRLLIRLAAKFGEYDFGKPQSFRLSSHFSLYPQFMFHLRRSQFLKTANNTPDETAFFRLMLNREPVTGSLVMIQPTLLAYSFQRPPVPLTLDIASVQSDEILLFDSFFCVLVHFGFTVAQWRKAGFADDPAHEHFRSLLRQPVRDAEALAAERNPPPRLVLCDQHGSQARFLLAKLNPSMTHRSNSIASQVIFTDDVSLEQFVLKLHELAVQEKKS
eukprot:SM000256S08691  [mRNA]  locus=s256:34458:38927:- [translate_table: standard]